MLRTGYEFWLLPLLCLIATGAGAQGFEKYKIGAVIDDSVFQSWAINVQPTSTSLPAGKGNASDGADVFEDQCASCHGDDGEGIKWEDVNGAFPSLIGADRDPKNGKNIGSYWPYASTLYDYINRAMPITAPGSLATDEVYSLVAFLLYRNGVIKQDVVVSSENLNSIKMPNRDGFLCDNRPVSTGVLCMNNCLTPQDGGFILDSDQVSLSKIAPVPVSDCYLK